MIAERCCAITGADGAAVNLLADGRFVRTAGAGSMGVVDGQTLPIQGSLAGLAVTRGEGLYSSDALSDDRVFHDRALAVGAGSLVAVPMRTGSTSVGALTVVSQRPAAFTQADVEIPTELGEFLAVIVRSALTMDERRREHEAYHLIAESGGDVIMQISLDGVVQWASPAVADVYDRSPADMVGRLITEVIRPDHVERFRSAAATGRQSGADQRLELACVRADGRTVWVDVLARAQRDVRGGISHWVVRVRDISAAHEAREDLARSEEMFRTAMEHAPIGQALIGLDGTFLQVNAALCELLGRSERELLHTTWREVTHPDDVNQDLMRLRELVDGRRDACRLVKRYLRPDGTVVWGDLAASSLRDADGTVFRLVAQVVDVTEAKMREVQVRATAQRFRRLAEHGADVLVQYDLTGRTIWVSPNCQELLGRTAEEVLGDASVDVIPESHRRQVRAEMLRLAGSDEEGHLEFPILRPDGSTVWVDSASKPLIDENGRRLGRVARLRDITEEVHERQDLQQRATRDPLTGLMTRDEGYRRLAAALEHLPRRGGEGILAFIDVDDLKEVNDEFGHGAGDELLRVVARRIRGSVREDDVVARVGGDEIIVILNGVGDDEQGARVLADMLDPGPCAPLPRRCGPRAATQHRSHADASRGGSGRCDRARRCGHVRRQARWREHRAVRGGGNRVPTRTRLDSRRGSTSRHRAGRRAGHTHEVGHGQGAARGGR